MATKRLIVLGCVLVAALLAFPAGAGARPASGAWNGRETKWWTGSHWSTYTETYRVAFRLSGRRVLRFRSAGYIPWTCSDGSEERTKAPWVSKAGVRFGRGAWRFSGKRTVYGSRRMTAYVKGSFRSSRRASGKIVVKRQGCGAYRSLWTAKGPKRHRTPTPPPTPTPGPTPPSPICIPYPYGGCWIL